MNVPRKKWTELLELARREPVPAVDVADRVVESLRVRPRAPSLDWAMVLACAVSVAAAILVMAFASHEGVLQADPLADLFQPMIPVLQ
jgi:hypothetical protein